MADLTELKGLVEQINQTLVPLRSEVDALKTRDGLDEERLDRMATEVAKKAQAAHDLLARDVAQLKARELGGINGPVRDDAEAKAKFESFLRSKKRDGDEIEIRAMSTTSGPDGGYLVLPEFSQTIMSRIFETSPLRLVANVEQTGTKSRTFLIDDDEGSAQWIGEATEATEDTPALAQVEITAQDVVAKMNATNDMLDDAYIDLAAWLVAKGGDKLARAENTAFVSGNGVMKPRGFTTYPNWASAGTYERQKIEQIVTGVAGGVGADGLINLQYSLKAAYQANAVWGMKMQTFGAALKLKGSDTYYFSPVMLRDGVVELRLLGKPVVFMDDMPAEGAGNLPVVYADFSRAYTIVDRAGFTILRNPYRTSRFTIFEMTRRTGGDVTNFDAIKLNRCST